eukprot:jgi/Bigna1/141572/aug1.63_g16280
MVSEFFSSDVLHTSGDLLLRNLQELIIRTPPSASMSVLTGLLTSVGQTAVIFALEFLCRKYEIFLAKHMEGLNKFIATISVPAIFFLGLATLNADSVSFTLFAAMALSKILIYMGTCAVTYIVSRNEGDNRPGMIGIFGIFTTQSNVFNMCELFESIDIALGLPIITASFGEEYGTYIFLLAPVQLLFLNLISLILMETTAQKKLARERMEIGVNENGSASIACIVLSKLIKSPIIMSCVIGLFVNVTVGSENIPVFFGGIFRVLANTYAGCALFSLGLSIDPNMKGGNNLAVSILVATKVLLMPMVMAIIARIMTRNEGDTQFAFIYGMLPTAPTAYILAVAYGVQEPLLSTACLVRQQLYKLRVNNNNIYMHLYGESDVQKSNEVSISVFLVMCYLAREKRPIKGSWRVVCTLAAVTIALMSVKLACLNNSEEEITDREAVGLHLWEVGFQLLQSGYGLTLCVVLYARLSYNKATVLKTEKYGHAVTWGAVLIISLIFCIPGVTPRFRGNMDKTDSNYAQSVLMCHAWDPISFQVIKLLTLLGISISSIYMIIKYQFATSTLSERLKIPQMIRNQQKDDKVYIHSNYLFLDTYIINIFCKKSEGLLLDDALSASGTLTQVDSEPYSEIGDVFERDEPPTSFMEMKVVNRVDEAYRTVAAPSPDSSRYTMKILFIAFGIVLVDFHFRYSQVIFVLYICFRLSLGVAILLLWFGQSEMQWGLRNAYDGIVSKFPWIERFRLLVLSQFSSLDVMPGSTYGLHAVNEDIILKEEFDSATYLDMR